MKKEKSKEGFKTVASRCGVEGVIEENKMKRASVMISTIRIHF